MDELPDDIEDNIKKYRKRIQNSDNNFIVLKDGFGAGKTTASMTCLSVGDAIVFDTHTQVKEKMRDYQRELSHGKCIQLASLQKYIGQYNWKRNGAGEKQNVIIPPKIESQMDKISRKKLSDFKNIIQRNVDKPYSPKFLAIKHDFDEEIHKLADIYSNLYNEKTLKTKIVFTVKHLINVLDHKGNLYIDEKLQGSKNKTEMDVLKAGSEIDDKYVEARKTNTPKDLKSIMDKAGSFLKIFYKIYSQKSEWLEEYHQINEQILREEMEEYDEFEELRDFDRNEFLNKFYDAYLKRDDKEVYPELEVVNKIIFASRLFKYGGAVTLDGGVKARVTHEFCYDAFKKGIDNKVVMMDAEFKEEWFRTMFSRWNHAEKGGVSLEDKGIEQVELNQDKKIDAEYHYVNIGEKGNSTIRMNCYSYYDKANKYVKKHLNLRIVSQIIKHRNKYSDETHGVVTTKKGKDNLFSDYDNVLHFAEMEGSNKLKDVDYIWVIGTPRVREMKRKVEEEFGEPLDTVEEIAEKYGKNYYDFITPSYFNDGSGQYNLKGKSDFKKKFSFDVDEDDKETITKYQMIWDMEILAKVRQAIGRKRDLENGKIIRIGINHHSFYSKFKNREYHGIKTFIKEQFKENYGAMIDSKEELNRILEEKSDMKKIIDYIPKNIRRHFGGSKDIHSEVELGKKPRGYNKENLVRYMYQNDYSMREIERNTKKTKKEIKDIVR